MDRSIISAIAYMRSALSACSVDGLGTAPGEDENHNNPQLSPSPQNSSSINQASS